MRHLTSTDAQQNFGELMKLAAMEPVAIERHRKVQAIVAAPEFFRPAGQDDRQFERRLARAQQAVVDRDRLIRHQKIAFDLVTLTEKERAALIADACAVVARWRLGRLCSRDFIDRWTAILALAPRDMAVAMTSDADGWGTALRQNSPWVGVHA